MADNYHWVVKEILFRHNMEVSSGLDKKRATAKALIQLNEEYGSTEGMRSGGNPTKGWSALALKRYCEIRVLERNVAMKPNRLPSPVAEDFEV